MKKRSLLAAAFLASSFVFGGAAFAEDVNDWTELKNAIESGTTDITLTADITLPDGGDAYATKSDSTTQSLTLTGRTIQQTTSTPFNSSLLTVNSGSLSLTGGTFDSVKSADNGGVIYNNKTLALNNVDFNSNTVTKSVVVESGDASADDSGGGAIYNKSGATISAITGEFTSNSATVSTQSDSGYADSSYSGGGAIWNGGTMGAIDGDFNSNTASISAQSDSDDACTNASSGGAIRNSGTIDGDITGDFTSNRFLISVQSNQGRIVSDCIGGGAIGNGDTILGSIAGNFVSNSVVISAVVNSDSGDVDIQSTGGGAIWNEGQITGDITGDFISNSVTASAQSDSGDVYSSVSGGGAIRVNGTIGKIDGDFISNSVTITPKSDSGYVALYESGGGAIWNGGTINGPITGDFISNSVTVSAQSDSGNVDTVSFGGGAIRNSSTMDAIDGDFKLNSLTVSAQSGSGDVYSNYSGGGAIWNWGDIDSITGNFTSNSAIINATSVSGTVDLSDTGGGAIWNNNTISNIADSSFVSNYTNRDGGAIFNGEYGTITFSGTNTFSGNKQAYVDAEHYVLNDIYNKGTLNFGGTNTLEGGIDGATSGIANHKVNITDGITTVGYSLKNQNVTVNGGELHLAGWLDGTTPTATDTTGSAISVSPGAIINTTDNLIKDYTDSGTGKITLSDGAKIRLDVDLAGGNADKFVISSGTVKLAELKLLSDSAVGDTDINIADSGSVDASSLGDVFTTAYKYTVAGNDSDSGKITVTNTGLAGGLKAAIEATASGAVVYSVTDSDSSVVLPGVSTKHDLTVYGPGTGITDPKITLGGNLEVGGTDTTTTFQDTKVDGTGSIINDAGNNLVIKDSYIGVLVKNYGTMISDPTVYKAGVLVYDGASFTATGDSFEDTDRTGENGGAIFNEAGGTVTLTDVTFLNNKADNGGAIYNAGTATISDAVFGKSGDTTYASANSATNGGAIYNTGTLNITNSNFYYNTSSGLGGAIYSTSNVTISSASGTNVVFEGNRHSTGTTAAANDIYMAGTSAETPITLALNAVIGRSISLGSGVDGQHYNINVNSGEGNTGTVNIASLANAGALTLNAGTLNLSADTTVASLTAKTAILNATNGLTTGALTTTSGEKLTNSGKLTLSTSENNALTNSGTIANNGTLTIKGSNDTGLTSFENAGTINGSGTTVIGGANATLLSNNGTISNNITIAANAELHTDPDTLTVTNGNLLNDGTLSLTAGTIKFNVNNNSGTTGHTDILGNLVDFGTNSTPYVINQQINILNESTSADDIVLVAHGSNIGGNVALNDLSDTKETILRLTGGTLNYNVDGYTQPSTDTKTYGNLEITDNTTLAAGKTVNVSDLSVYAGKTFTNNNSVTVRDGLSNSGTIANSTSGILNLYGGESSTDKMTNAGTISGGTVNVGYYTSDSDKDTAYVANTGSITGSITVANGSTLEQSTNTASMGAVTNNGTLLISNGSVASVINNAVSPQGVTQTGGSVTGNVSNSGTYTISNGTIGGTVTNNKTFNMQGGSVSVFKQETSTADLNISNSATMTLGAGSVISAGKVSIASGSILDITGTSETSRAVVTLDGGTGLTNVVWDGEVKLNGGQLILANIIDQTRVTGTDPYNKTGKLTATTGELTIHSTNVLLGNQDTIADAVKVTLNTEKLSVGKSGAETASVYIGTDDTWKGVIELANSGTVTLDGTTTAVDTVTPANSNSLNAQSGTLNLVNTGTGTGKHGSATGVTFGNSADKVMYNVATTVTADKLNINAGQVQFNGSGTGVDNLNSAGTITLAGGQLDLDGVKTGGTSGTNARLVANTGKLNIQATQGTNHVTELAYLSGDYGDTIAKAVETTIASGATLKINSGKANVTLDSATGSADDWSGNVELAAGSLTLDTITKATTSSPVSTYVQTGGALTMIDSSLTLNESGSKITNGSIAMTSTSATTPYSAGSQLVFNNGTAAANANAAVITSDANTNNSITVGGTNGAKLKLKASTTPAENSVINANTAVTITNNGTLTAYGESIQGGGTATTITNDGIFNLSNNGSTAGTIARAINKSTSTITTGTVNLTGTTLSTAAGTINQANLNVGDGSGTVDSSTFTMGANVTLSDTLKVFTDGKIVNATKDIVTDKITVQSTGSIVGSSGTGASEGNFTVINGGSNAGTISQSIVSLTGGTLDNTGTLTANGLFTSAAVITDTATSGTLNINKGGSSTAAITQKVIAFNPTIADTTFTNSADMTATASLTNAINSIINSTADINVQNATPLTTPALLTNNGTINSETGDINADNVVNGGTVSLKKSDLVISYQSGDLAGTLKVIGDAKNDISEVTVKDITTGSLIARDITETVNVESGTMKLIAGNITEGASTSIAAGSRMNVKAAARSDASVVISTGDTFNGDLVLDEGKVTIKDIVASTVATETTALSTNPYYEQNGGELDLVNATLTMEKANKINAPAGKMNIDKDSHFVSQSGAFTVKDLQNAGTVHSINGEYENHLFDNHIVGNGTDDSQADYTTDLYARSNSNKKYDQFGKDGAVISAANTTTHKGTVHIFDWQLNGDIYGHDAPIDRSINFNHLFKGSVLAGDTINFTSTNKEVDTPIGWYALHSKGGGNYALDLVRFNDKVFRGQVTTLAQYQNQLAIDDMLFNHTMIDQGFKGNDYITGNPNQYASANDVFAPYQYSRKDGGLWVKMYGNFEKLHAGGMDIGNNAYGTIIGADFGLKDLKRGWQFMPTAYVGYNGAHQYWNGNGAYQNGAQLGFMGTFYKNDFMIGTLAYGGFYGNEMSTPRGNDQAFNYFAGGAVKTAYNWKFKKNWALQPNFLVAYSFFGQENWHTDFGQMGMMSGMLHGINIAPGLNLIYERETWSTYLTIQYMYNVNQAVGGRAGNVDLPRLSMDRGYLQYGIGINKKFTDRFSGYFQTVIRNVGRNGVGLQMGFQWKLGKGGKATTKKSNVTPELKKTQITINGNRVQ